MKTYNTMSEYISQLPWNPRPDFWPKTKSERQDIDYLKQVFAGMSWCQYVEKEYSKRVNELKMEGK